MRVQLALLVGLLAAAPVTAQGPLVADADVVDVGIVVAGETASATFVLRNPTEAPVRIVRAAPS